MKKHVLLVCLMIFVATACRRAQQPPDGVPASAVFVPGPKGGWWQVCVPPEEMSLQVSCSVYNLHGETLYSESFVAVDQQPLPSNLAIDPTANLVGPAWINLKGGRILFPGSRANELRRFLAGTISQ